MPENRFERYGIFWPKTVLPIKIHTDCIARGGQWTNQSGKVCGKGMLFHFKEFISDLWPWIVWHPWAELQLKCYLENRIIGQIGPASTGKSFIPAACVLADYYLYPSCTTVLVSSTTRESLEMRVWGEIKKLHRQAKAKYEWLSGYLIEGRQRIVSDPRHESAEGRDFRNGLVGVACKRGQSFQGIEEYCFPSGTLVDTTDGQRPIETIKPGDTVMSAVGPSRVSKTISRTVSEILRMSLSDGRNIDCTPNHRFLTELGWKNAIDIHHGDVLISPYETMQILREEVPAKRPSWNFLRQVLLSEMDGQTARNGCEKAGQHGFQEHGQENQRGFNEQPKGENEKKETDEKASSIYSGTKKEAGLFTLWRNGNRTQKVSNTKNLISLVSRVADGFLCANRKEFQNGNGASLLFRSGVAGIETGRGDRRSISQERKSTGERSAEGLVVEEQRVDSIKILRHEGISRSNFNGGEYTVHNLEVEGHPSYSVQNCVVHNCGIKNKRLRMVGDEMQFLPRSFVDSIANLNKNANFKGVYSGNPKDTTDALGVLCEPAASLGGWDGGIDQTPKTKTWPIRFPGGICIQLVGSDSPNLDGKLGIPLITQEQIDIDIAFYGKDSLQFSMMDEGRMPRGQGSRRVITRQMCLKFGSMEEPQWLNSVRTRIGFLDAAYKGVGGDRCVFGELQFGQSSERKQIMALIDTLIIPIRDMEKEMPEDQIAMQVKEECERRGIPPEQMFFDSTGRGSLMGAFGRLWSPKVVPVEFGGKASERTVSAILDVTCRDYYFNFVTELWYSVRNIIEGGQFRGMTEDVMLEGCSREWTFVGSNKIQVEPKDKMKIKTGRSPDLFDGLVCGVEGARRMGFVIEKSIHPGYSRQDDTWKRQLSERARKLRTDHELSLSK